MRRARFLMTMLTITLLAACGDKTGGGNNGGGDEDITCSRSSEEVPVRRL